MKQIKYFLEQVCDTCKQTQPFTYNLTGLYIDNITLVNILKDRFNAYAIFDGTELVISEPLERESNEFRFYARERKVLELATLLHNGQTRKKSGLPYISHPIEVAFIAFCIAPLEEFVIEIGLLHDTVEDCDITSEKLEYALFICGYNMDDVCLIVNTVVELTTTFSKEHKPSMNRTLRKIGEAKRLWSVSHKAQIVKTADITHNTSDVDEMGTKYAVMYIGEKLYTLEGFTVVNPYLEKLTNLLKTKELELLH